MGARINKNPALTRIELTTSARGVRGYLLNPSGDEVRVTDTFRINVADPACG